MMVLLLVFLWPLMFGIANSSLGETVDLDVFSRGLVSKEVGKQDILDNHNQFYRETSRSRFNSTVLGYVTPWNNAGYDVAKIFGKFSLISPVWLQIKPKSSRKGYQVTGTHDVDSGWISDVRKSNQLKNVKIVPRVLFEGFRGQDYSSLFSDSHLQKSLCKTLTAVVSEHGFDGVVLELWSQVAGALGNQRHLLHSLVSKIAAQMKKRSLLTILVIPPVENNKGEPGVFDSKDFSALRSMVDYFSLMTYDYSSPYQPGPNSPLSWVERCITSLTADISHRAQILMGLNFYGYDYTSGGGGPIVGSRWLQLLSSAESLDSSWDDQSSEHMFTVVTPASGRKSHAHQHGSRHMVFFPSLLSLQTRLQLASQLGVGLAVWELGQGLTYFFDLL